MLFVVGKNIQQLSLSVFIQKMSPSCVSAAVTRKRLFCRSPKFRRLGCGTSLTAMLLGLGGGQPSGTSDGCLSDERRSSNFGRIPRKKERSVILDKPDRSSDFFFFFSASLLACFLRDHTFPVRKRRPIFDSFERRPH